MGNERKGFSFKGLIDSGKNLTKDLGNALPEGVTNVFNEGVKLANNAVATVNDPELRDFLESRAIQSVLIVKLDTFNEFYGYIMLCEKQITRVWQESEIALVMYAASLLELKLKKDNY